MAEILIAGSFLVMGGYLLYRALLELVLAISSRNWPTAPGIVLVSDLQRSKDSEGGIMYRSELAYRYTVEDRELIGSRARFGDRIQLSWSKPAVMIVRKYKTGTEVCVRYDPEEPTEAVLEPGVTGMVWAELATGLGFVLMGVLWLVSRFE